MKQMYTLAELAQRLERQAETKVDYLADTRQMHFVTQATAPESPARAQFGLSRSLIDLLPPGGGEAVVSDLLVNDVAHGQIAAHLGIPQRYYQRLRTEVPALLDENVNRLMRHAPTTRMLRTLDGTGRAFLSDAYRRIDNDEIARAVFPILSEMDGLQVRSCGLTDTRMHIKAVTPRVQGAVRGQEVCAGVYIGNSEVGYGAVTVYPFVEVLVCTNGMVVQQAGAGMMRQVHVGRRVEADNIGRILRPETVAADDRAFIMALGDVVRAAVDEVRFRELIAQMEAATSGERVTDPVAAIQVLSRREGLSEHEGRDVLRHLAEGGDLTRWGMLNAVTRTAEDVESYDRATELEQLGGKILAYARRDWREVAEASDPALAAA